MDSDDVRFESIKQADEAKNAFIEVRAQDDFNLRASARHAC
jgi:hypothetical protein